MDSSKQKSDVIIERVDKGLCPICGLPLNAEKKEDTAFESYKGVKRLVHKRHLREKKAS